MTHSLEATGRQAGTQAGAHPSPAAPPLPTLLCAPRESYHVEARQFSSLANRICQVYCAATVVSVYESNMRARSPVKVGRGGGARQSWLGGGALTRCTCLTLPPSPHLPYHVPAMPCRAPLTRPCAYTWGPLPAPRPPAPAAQHTMHLVLLPCPCLCPCPEARCALPCPAERCNQPGTKEVGRAAGPQLLSQEGAWGAWGQPGCRCVGSTWVSCATATNWMTVRDFDPVG